MLFKGFEQYYCKSFDDKKIGYIKNFKRPTRQVIVFTYGPVSFYHHFKYQVKNLGSKFDIILHDYRGHYESEGINDLESITFENIAKDVEVILKREEISAVHMVGHSMGVNTTLEIAKRKKVKLKSITLIAGTPLPLFSTIFDSHLTDLIFPLIMKLYKKYPSSIDSFWTKLKSNIIATKLVRLGGFNIYEVSDDFVEIYLQKVSELGASLFIHLLQQMNKQDILRHLTSIKTQTLIIAGEKDKIIPVKDMKLLQNELSHSELLIIKDGSHVPQVDFPRKINARITKLILATSLL